MLDMFLEDDKDRVERYDKADFTYGMEIEWGDVDRTVGIPSHLGSWEYSERDIVNLRAPYKNVCADPLGVSPPVGGEINTIPSKTWGEQVERFNELKQLFIDNGTPPTVCATSHTHIHCRVPGLSSDIESLHRLIRYVKDNQAAAVNAVYGFTEHAGMKDAPGSKSYLKFDGGRLMPNYMISNILKLSTDFDSFIKMHAAGKDGVSMGRPFRYAINTYALKHIDTIEFRLFRGTDDPNELASCFKFVEAFLDAALNDGDSVSRIISEGDFNFPPMQFDVDQFKGWKETKHPENRGKKERELLDVS